jgi:hypothetical protein
MTTGATADLLALRALHDRIALATDSGDWDAFRDCFVPEAHADYGELGIGAIEQILDAIRESQSRYAGTLNVVGTHRAVVSGDGATADTYVVSHHFRHAEGTAIDDEAGTHYADELVRTKEGWKISRRVARVRFFRSTATMNLES